MDELISRQAAIDALEDAEDAFGYLTRDWREVLMELPPAEPQIIRCKDCKHHWTYKCMDSMPIERCDLEQTFYDAERDFCSLAERRTE